MGMQKKFESKFIEGRDWV